MEGIMKKKEKVIDVLFDYVFSYVDMNRVDKVEKVSASTMEEAEYNLRNNHKGDIFYVWKIEQTTEKGKLKKIFPI
jgi:hypothetical protein